MEICSKKNTRESVVGTLLPYNRITLTNIKKKKLEDILDIIVQKSCKGWKVWVNPLKKENLQQKLFSNNFD